MKITLFTSNHPRHLSLIERLSGICDELYVIQEATTLNTGVFSDVYKASDLHALYFSQMQKTENEFFGEVRFLSLNNTKILVTKIGDASSIPLSRFGSALDSDYFVVFGAGYIKGDLVKFLIKKRAINIHMGVSPYFRGAACNFWALYKGRADLVGATIHMISEGLDSGEMLFHTLPAVKQYKPFEVGMAAVKAAHEGLCHHLQNGTIFDYPSETQDRSKEIFYSKKVDFNTNVISNFLKTTPSETNIHQQLLGRTDELFLRPFYA